MGDARFTVNVISCHEELLTVILACGSQMISDKGADTAHVRLVSVSLVSTTSVDARCLQLK